ncbi:Spy0128 family protein [Aristaeella hokkaidonensis]|uniref:Cna B-type domain-containing protein n=1 Tax=Aristaeella hokkaidonensis TaxID=3046382 RepID=A0AC61MWI8_9FIRM|nr:FctA domain-containing protein [Aristaeella hokkaidonensis]QUC65803.1 Cna B-type domain-containing protein [Aristaeella hokkaidonensis]SNT93985.1 LPXTG-motif cell wall anchor domain-containing protein [Aristaeella hokkaidonensis]
MFRSIRRPVVLLLILLALFIALNGALSLSVGYAAGTVQIRDAKLKWVTTDYDGIPERLLLKKEYDNGTFSVQYQMDIVLTGAEAHAPGTVRITAPKQIFHQRSSRPDGSVQAAGYGNMTYSVPAAPAEGSSWHREDTGDGRYVIVNDATIDAAASLMFQCTITGLQPNRLVDMLPSDPLKVTVEVTARDGTKDTMDTQELTAVIDTRAALTTYGSTPGASLTGTVYNSSDNISPNVLSNLPGGAETANGYVFVCWKTRPYYDASQYFRLDMDLWAGEAAGNEAAIPGIVLGRTAGGGTVTTQDSGAQAGEHYSRTVTTYDWDDKGTQNGNRMQNIWVAYPTAQMQANKTYTIRAAAAWKMTEADPARGNDPQEVTEKSVDASVNYTHSGWEYPAGRFGVYKYTDSHPDHTHPTIAKDVPDGSENTYHNKNHTYAMAVGALRNNQPVTIEYEVLTAGYGYKYTAGPTSEVPDLPEGWEYDPAHYLNWNYLMETTDDTLTVQNVSGALQPGDYCFTGITVGAPEMFSYGYLQPSQSQYMMENSTFGYKPDNSLPKPDVEVWVKYADGSWALLETVSLRSGTKKITFPEGVIGYKTRFATNQAACKVAVWPTVKLLPSDHLKDIVETVLRSHTNVVVDNDAELKTTYYYSATRPEEVQPSQEAWLQAAAAGSFQETSDSSSATLAVAGFSVYGNAGIEPDPPKNDTVNRRIKASMYMYVDEKSNLSTLEEYNAAVAAGAVIPETSGTWYLLLPENMTPVMSSVSLRSGDRIIEKEVYENFRGSGRALLVVRGTLSPDVSDSYSGAKGYFTDRIFLSLDAYMPWEDYADLEGNKYVKYYAAFESGNPGTLGNLPSTSNYYQSIGYPDAWPNISGTWLNINSTEIRDAMTDLDPDTDEARFVYLYGSLGLGNINIMNQVEFRKDVRAGSTGAWAKGTAGETQVTVTEGGSYTYRMTVAAKNDSYIGGIMFYDAIEEFAPADDAEPGLAAKKAWSGEWQGKGQWKGTLVSVDLTELISKGFGPWVYYTEKPGLKFGAQGSIDTTDTHGILQSFSGWNSDYNLFNQDLWKRVPEGAIVNGVWTVPEGTKVAAIAVDAQRGTNPRTICLLSPGDKVSVYLNMKAPSDGGSDSKWNAKGAYAHKTDNASSPDDVDWIAAMDPASNMYAYNQAAAVYLRFSTPNAQASHGYARDRSVLDFEYTRLGIVPETILVRKTWVDKAWVTNVGYMENHDGLRPDQVTVKLKGVPKLPSGTALTAENNTTFEDTLVLTADDGWQGIFRSAPALDRYGVPYAYTVTEDPVPGYSTAVYKDDNRSYEIVNKHEREQVTITGRKLWLYPDGSPAEPDVDKAQMNLRRVNEKGETEQIPFKDYHKNTNPSKDNSWTYTFSGYERYAPGGYEYKYVLVENTPSGWFSQNDAVPAGVTVTAEYDPDDLTTFRNFKNPDFGYAMIYTYVTDDSRPAEGNNTVLPSFDFILKLTNGDEPLDGEYEYLIYNKGPNGTNDTTIPADAVVVGSGTVCNNGTITLEDKQCAKVIGLPAGSKCKIEKQPPAGWSTRGGNDTYVIRSAETVKFNVINDYTAEGYAEISGTKRLLGREQRAGEFSFEVLDENQRTRGGDENENYGQVIDTVKTGASRGTVTGGDGTVTGLAMFTFTPEFGNEEYYPIYEYGGTKTLHYKFREKVPEGAQTVNGVPVYDDVTYDTREIEVAIIFTDNKDGTLKATVTTATGDPLSFTNTYAFKRNITLTAHKELVGRTLQPEEFSFEVRRKGAPADSAPIATGKNDAEGNVTFTPDIILTERDLDAISSQTGIGDLTFLISEVQGTDPTVAYMTTPREAKVQIAQTEDGKLLVAMPGQTIKRPEILCNACGGTGEAGGFSAVIVDVGEKAAGEIINLNSFFNAEYMDICSNCGGTGYASDGTGGSCTKCNGAGATFKACTHPNFNMEGNYCPDCIYNFIDMKGIHLSDGNVLLIFPYGGPFTLAQICAKNEMDPAGFPASASRYVMIAYLFTEEHWDAITKNPDYVHFTELIDRAAIVYLVDGGTNNTCPVCNGNKVIPGGPYIDGDALPVQLVNYLNTEVSFTAEKTLEGQPASEPFTFVLLETDEERRTETEIARTQNGTDGKIAFEPIALNPATPKTYYYIVREVADAENRTIAYDTGEDIYKVTVSLDDDGIPVVDKKLMSGDGVFRNTYKGGTLEIEVKTGGHIPHWPWWHPPKFPVNVVLKDCEGRPLAGYPLPTSTQKVKVSAKAGNGMLTVSDVMTRAESTTGNVTDSEGRGTILIEGGSVATITGLPDGVTYEASQPADSMPKGYSQGSAEGTTGTIRAGQVSKATFENNYKGEEGEEPAPTSEQPKPSAEPTPSDKPTDEPTVKPTATSTAKPTDESTVKPVATPTAKPTDASTAKPTDVSTVKPTEGTTVKPTETPKATPTAAPAPTDTSKPQPVPKTGDTDNPMLWVGLILIGLIGIGGLAYGKYRKKK